MEDFYSAAIESAGEVNKGQDVGALARFAEYQFMTRLRRFLGPTPTDDFNSRPVAGRSRILDRP